MTVDRLTDKELRFLFLTKQYGLERNKRGWHAIGHPDVSTTRVVIERLVDMGLIVNTDENLLTNSEIKHLRGMGFDAAPDEPIMAITHEGRKLLDDISEQAGITFGECKQDWVFKGWRVCVGRYGYYLERLAPLSGTIVRKTEGQEMA